MTLENLARIGKLRPHKTTRDEITRLLAASRRNVEDSQVAAVSLETRFDAAYKAIMQCGLIALLANGYRPSTNEPGHHATVIQSLGTTLGVPNERWIVLDKLRKARNLTDYTGEGVSEAMLESCQRAARALLAAVEAWLRANRPDLVGIT